MMNALQTNNFGSFPKFHSYYGSRKNSAILQKQFSNLYLWELIDFEQYWLKCSGGSMISQRGAPTTKGVPTYYLAKFQENCMKVKKIGLGAHPKFYYVDDPPLKCEVYSNLDFRSLQPFIHLEN